MECNPNMIDSLFVPINCITHSTQIGNLVRENRKLFLHRGAYFKFKGYCYSQLHKMSNKNPIGIRKEIIDKVKFGYHVVRLLQEIEQILIEGDLDLQRGNEVLKSIRRGEKTAEWIIQFFADKERHLEEAYTKSTLPNVPDEDKIKELLLNCLEIHYGNLQSAIINEKSATKALRQIQDIISNTIS